MDEQSITLLTEKIVSDISFWTALIGLGGVVIGALIAIVVVAKYFGPHF